jgi:hypothetical protein
MLSEKARVYKRDVFCTLQLSFIIVHRSRYLVLNRGNTTGWNRACYPKFMTQYENTGNIGASDVCLFYSETAPGNYHMW